ncbi:hypothetical protein F4678DRAFT_476993 [Xylaria arbuscula]|nr:hypothetical protein F4678DRAFT_476993 [Xylaria arbuscula]
MARLARENIGYLIHPPIIAALPKAPVIADVATGAGRFLFVVVHVRMLVAGILPEDWQPAVLNLSRMRKLGGFLQWTECDFITLKHLRGSVDSSVEHVRTLDRTFGTALRHMETSGLEVFRDIMVERGQPGAKTLEEFDLLEENMIKDIRSGAYDIHVICGRKPLN